MTYALSENTTSPMRSSRRRETKFLIAPFTASRRVFPGGRRAAPVWRLLNVGFCSERAGRARSIASCMLDDKSSTTTMSRPRDWIWDSEYGRTGSISAQAVSASAATSVTKGMRRRIDARLERSIHLIVAAAANRRRPRQRKSATTPNAASSHQPSWGWRNRMSAHREHLLRLLDGVAAGLRRAGAVARVAHLFARGQHRRDHIRRRPRSAGSQRRPDFGGGEAVDRNAAG